MRPIASCSRRRGVPRQPYNVSSAWPGPSGWFVVFRGLASTWTKIALRYGGSWMSKPGFYHFWGLS